MTRLTSKQQTVLEFVEQFFLEHRHAPLIREIQSGCNIASYKSTIDRLNALERKGFLKRTPNKHRGIRLSHKPHPAPATAGAGVDGSALRPGMPSSEPDDSSAVGAPA